MIKAIITDIEGTTSSLSYVKQVMFPYSRERLRDFLQKNWHEERIRKLISELERRLNTVIDLDLSVKTFEEWIDLDIKDPLLKELQGHIWEEGFLSGELRGHIYEDAYVKLKEWKERGFRLYVYSSGSEKAQRLFFGNTDYGDLTTLFDGFFDTSVGGKKDPKSYIKIAEFTGFEPQECLFISDVEEELDASKAVGMQTVHIVRDSQPVNSRHRVVKNFNQIQL